MTPCFFSALLGVVFVPLFVQTAPLFSESDVDFDAFLESEADDAGYRVRRAGPNSVFSQETFRAEKTVASGPERWAEAAYAFVQTLKCGPEGTIFRSRECRSIKSIPRNEMAVWAAAAEELVDAEAVLRSANLKLAAVLPDGGLSRAGLHDAVVVLDPFPEANFGHIVLVFFVDYRHTARQCERKKGMYLGSDACLTMAAKNRCHNVVDRRHRKRNWARRCDINFLPVVHAVDADAPNALLDGKRRREEEEEEESYEIPAYDSEAPEEEEDEEDEEEKRKQHREKLKQRLVCRKIKGFAACPKIRPLNETAQIICDPLDVNTRRCLTTHETVNTRCRPFEICDQAVIVSGGWNREAGRPHHRENVKRVYKMLRTNGFKKSSIKTFYANGDNITVPGEAAPIDVVPASMKFALRYHLIKMCANPHCVDSLVLYLNSPTKHDGSMLLWDLDGNGEASINEMYSIEELVSDLAWCEARSVHIIADQSFSGELGKAFHKSPAHNRTVVYTSGTNDQYSWGDDFTYFWTSRNHTHACTRQVGEQSKNAVSRSTPKTHEGKMGAVSTTLFGAPCHVIPPFTHEELRREYRGCQNLPTALWLLRFSAAASSSSSSSSQPRLESRAQALHEEFRAQETRSRTGSGAR